MHGILPVFLSPPSMMPVQVPCVVVVWSPVVKHEAGRLLPPSSRSGHWQTRITSALPFHVLLCLASGLDPDHCFVGE